MRRRVISKPSVRLSSAPPILLAKYEALRLVLGGHEDSHPCLERSGSDRPSRRRKQTVSSSQKATLQSGSALENTPDGSSRSSSRRPAPSPLRPAVEVLPPPRPSSPGSQPVLHRPPLPVFEAGWRHGDVLQWQVCVPRRNKLLRNHQDTAFRTRMTSEPGHSTSRGCPGTPVG